MDSSTDLTPSGFLLEQDRSSCHLTDHLSQLYENQTGFDVVIHCSDYVQLKAHRSVLAAASQYFQHIFKEQPRDDITIVIQGYSGRLVEKLIEFAYTGSTNLSSSEEAPFSEMLTDFEVAGAESINLTGRKSPLLQAMEEEDLFMDNEMNTEESTIDIVDKTFKCQICGQVLKTKTGLRMHLLVHQGSKGKTFSCGVCGKAFSQASQLKTHTRIHTGEKPYKCDQCERSFSHASTLSEHKNLHNAVKPFQCTVCQQSFAQKKALRAHRCQADESQSDKLKLFMCPFCNRTFTTRRGLSIHKMHQHAETSTEPILQCDQCAATFSSEQAYEEHLNSHFETVTVST